MALGTPARSLAQCEGLSFLSFCYDHGLLSNTFLCAQVLILCTLVLVEIAQMTPLFKALRASSVKALGSLWEVLSLELTQGRRLATPL